MEEKGGGEMALVYDGIPCAICEEPIDIEKPFFETSGMFIPLTDPLSLFCDAPMHWECYASWSERPSFARQHVKSYIEAIPTNPYWSTAYCDERVFITIRHDPAPPGGRQVNIWLFETGNCLSVPGKKWQQWIIPNSPQLGDMHRIETEALSAVLPMIRLRFPTVESLMAAIDWETEARLSAKAEAAAILAEQARIDSFSEHNRECKTLAEQLGISGLTCPHCSQRSTNIRFLDRSATEKSVFICRLCGRSFGPQDLHTLV